MEIGDVDEIAIERACYGDDVKLNTQERLVAVARLTARGVSGADTAARLHRCRRTVFRYRKLVRLIREAA